jgi:hypothetical protein
MVPRGADRWKDERHQHCDDGNDHQQLYERERTRATH